MAKRDKICRYCMHCRIPGGQNLYGICTEEHGPRNARGDLGKQVNLLCTCQYYFSKANNDWNQRRHEAKLRREEKQDVLTE